MYAKTIAKIKRALAADPIGKNELNQVFKEIYEGNIATGDIPKELFNATMKRIEAGIEAGFGKVEFGTPNYIFLNELKTNAAIFSAFKNHQQTGEIVEALFDETGKVRSFQAFKKIALTISKKYNETWLETEYKTAIRQARSAAEWKEFERTKHLYPNLEYMPSRSVDPRELHKTFYGIILPIDHPFWDEWLPPSDWLCECWVRKSKGEVSEFKEVPKNPIKGMAGNPGKTGQVFSPDHPYVKNTAKNAKKGIQQQLETLERNYIRLTAKTYAKQHLIGKTIKNASLNAQIEITGRSIKEVINQPHKQYNAKNRSIFHLPELLKTATYVKAIKNTKTGGLVTKFHYLSVEIEGVESFIVLKELVNGKLHFYTIVDKIKESS